MKHRNDEDEDRDDDQGSEGGDVALDNTHLFAVACAAFCRGQLSLPATVDDAASILAGRAAGQRLHRFKRARVLPRVQRIISTLRGLAPKGVLDVGTGRGVLLWPLLEAFPDTPIACVDVRADRIAQLRAVTRGGVQQLSATIGSIESLPHDDASHDVVIASEVLEHVADERAAARSLVRVARRFIIVTVPSVADNNPEHIRLFTADSLRALFVSVGAVRVSVDGVRGHLFALVQLAAVGADGAP